jgi:hypothetical protein
MGIVKWAWTKSSGIMTELSSPKMYLGLDITLAT